MSDEVQQLRRLVEELQNQVSFQEDSMGKLDDALAGQQQEILLLRRQLELLQARQAAFTAQQGAAEVPQDTDERPPHY